MNFLFTKPLGPDIVNVFADRRSGKKFGLFGNVGRKWGKNHQKGGKYRKKIPKRSKYTPIGVNF